MRTDLTASVELITPKRAAEMLSLLHPKQRKVCRDTVNDYIRAINQGDWDCSNDAVTFDVDKYLINGQHRLLACIETGVPIECVVFRGASCMGAMDQGRRRTLDQSLRARGIDTSKKHGQVIRAMAFSTQFSRKISEADAERFIKAYHEGIDFVRENIQPCVRAPVKGAIGRAYYYYPNKSKLLRFVQIVQAVFFGDNSAIVKLETQACDTAAMAAGNVLLATRRKRRGGGGSVNKDIYLRFETALVKFRAGEPCQRSQNLRCARKEQFPLKNCPENLKNSAVIGDQQ